MKTAREWFSTLPLGIAQKAMDNTTVFWLSELHESLKESLWRSFVWSDTPEGHEFWEDVFLTHTNDE